MEWKLLEYVGKRIAVTFNHEWEVVKENPDGTFEASGTIKKGRKTITGNVFLHDGIGMILEDDDIISHFTCDNGLELDIVIVNKYEITFLFDGKQETIQIDARNFANANYLATEHAIKNDFPSHSCKIRKMEVNN